MGPKTIQVLSEDLVNKIAAGEVIERPASVVKELVENSIDAAATQITVEVQEAGRKLIRVADNGEGMTKEECQLALQRHATSKISSLEDLFNIHSLGFRGEALPSIASVSKFTLEPNPSGRGITAEVKELFHNTPVRKKFLKAPATEIGHIGEVITKYALAYPEIAFELISNGKPLLKTAGTGKLMDVVVSIYGLDLAKGLVEVKTEQLNGLISRPNLTRIDKSYETFFVNRRYVKHFLLNRALEEAYRTLIPGNRYPIAILSLSVNPKEIDVNVHPAKREVKFQKTNEVMEVVRGAVKSTLENQIIRASERDYQNIRTSEYQTDAPKWQAEMAEILFPEASQVQLDQNLPFTPIAQLKNTYIVATEGEELILIDQHAAQERVIYDKLSSGQCTVDGGQLLMIPETIELELKDFQTLRSELPYLKELGLDVEEFGQRSLIVRSLPAGVEASATKILSELATDLQNLGKSAQLEIKQEAIRKSIACKAAIKAGDRLTQGEMAELIRQLYLTANPLTCPHGRPTIIKLEESEIARRFGR